MLLLLVLLLSPCGSQPTGTKVNYESLIREFLKEGETKNQVLAAIGSQFEELVDKIYSQAIEQDIPLVSQGKVHVLGAGGPSDPDNDPNFKIGGADELFEPERPIYGGESDRSGPTFGGKNDPGRPVLPLGGKGDPDHRRGSDPRKQSSQDATREHMPEDVTRNECDGDKEVSKSRLPRPYPLDKICAEIECPAFESVDRPNGTCGFEIRKYGPGKWVQTSFSLQEPGDLKTMTSQAFRKLFKYITGANSDNATIPMTAPVVTMYKMTEGEKMPSGATMMFYVPAVFQANTPVPTDPEVSIVDAKGTYTRYIRAFGGKSSRSPDVIKREFRILGWKLYKAGIQFSKGNPTVASYSAPWDKRQRHEVMFSDIQAEVEQSDEKRELIEEERPVQKEGPPKPYPIDKLCAEIECPPYTVIPLPEGASGFEMRRYSKANWVMTQLTDSEVKHPERGMGESFMKLFAYIQGQNEEKEKVPMTAPVVTVWDQDPYTETRNGGKLQFYIPKELQDKAPVPTGAGVEVNSQAEVVTLVRAMGGVPPASRYREEFVAMFNAMTQAGVCGDWSTIITAGYTAPWDPRKRTEIMVPQIDC